MTRIPGKVRTSDELLRFKAAPNGGVDVEGWASTNRKDRVGEILDETAWEGTLDDYRANGIILFAHDSKMPIGRATSVDVVRGKGLYLKARIPGGWQASDEAVAAIRAGVLKMWSVGFRENSPGVVDKSGTYHVVDASVYEVSAVAVPANQDCVFVMASDGKQLRAVELADAAPSRRPIRAALQRLRNEATLLRLQVELRDLTRQVARRKSVITYASGAIQDPGTAWDAGKARASLRAWATSAGGDIDFSKYKQGFGWIQPGQQDKLGGYSYPHHTYHGRLLVNLRGCRAVVAVIAGARGGESGLTDTERLSVYNHVARHIKEDFNADVLPFADLGKLTQPDRLAALHLTAADVAGV